jgi:tRNA threonylcarbamoyladenosine biosynthesis protein TsaB
MKILAFEFSAELRSVAVRVHDAPPVQVCETFPRERGPLALVDQTLRTAGVEREEIQLVAIGLGPGSYTGIRSSIALAQGWHLALGLRLTGVSSVEGLARLAWQHRIFGQLAIVVDAQRGEFYLARYHSADQALTPTEPLRLVDRSTVLRLRDTGVTLLGADAASVTVGATLLRPEASMIAQLASERSEQITASDLEPIYLREPRFVKAPAPRPIPKLD